MSGLMFDAPGPLGKRRLAVVNIACAIAVVGVLAYVLIRLNAIGQLSAESWSVLLRPDLQALFGRGLLATLQVSVVATLLSAGLGLLSAGTRLSSVRFFRVLSRAATEGFRGVPVLLLIFGVYLGLPVIGITVSSFWALVIGISLYNGAILAEIFRSGVLALPRGQREAAYSIGLTGPQTLRIVLLPQALRNMLPSIISQLVVILKESSLGFIVGYLELLRNATGAVTYLGPTYALPIYVALASTYIAINLALSYVARLTSHRSAARLNRPSRAVVTTPAQASLHPNNPLE